MNCYFVFDVVPEIEGLWFMAPVHTTPKLLKTILLVQINARQWDLYLSLEISCASSLIWAHIASFRQ